MDAENTLELDRKRRTYYSEQRERLRSYYMLLCKQMSLLKEAQTIMPPHKWEDESKELANFHARLPSHYEIYELLLEQEISFITNRTKNMEKYGTAVVGEDLMFLEKFTDPSDEYTRGELKKYYTALLGHSDPSIQGRAQSLLGIQ